MNDKTEEDEVLKNFMEEFFDFKTLCKAGFFTPEMKGDYKAQASRVCQFFGFKTVYEYGAKEIGCHITEAGERTEPFVTVIPNIYEQ